MDVWQCEVSFVLCVILIVLVAQNTHVNKKWSPFLFFSPFEMEYKKWSRLVHHHGEKWVDLVRSEREVTLAEVNVQRQTAVALFSLTDNLVKNCVVVCLVSIFFKKKMAIGS